MTDSTQYVLDTLAKLKWQEEWTKKVFGYKEIKMTNKLINEILEEADRIINGERQEQYGKAEDCFELIADYWNIYVKHKLEGFVKSNPQALDVGLESWNFEERILNEHDVAMMMILLKIVRTQGRKKKNDNYVDIAGYAALAAKLKE